MKRPRGAASFIYRDDPQRHGGSTLWVPSRVFVPEARLENVVGCYMVIDRKQETFFVLLEQTPSERQRIQRTP